MTALIQRIFALLTVLLCTAGAYAATDAKICELSQSEISQLPDPSRKPTKAERVIIDKAKLELLGDADGFNPAGDALIADVDNDGKEDVFVYNTQGSGRYVYAQLFDMSALQKATTKEPTAKTTLGDLGVLDAPRFVRFKGRNYIIFSDGNHRYSESIARLVKTKEGLYEQHLICQPRTKLSADTSCQHATCKNLRERIEDSSKNKPFVSIEWPHQYQPDAGLTVYFSDDWRTGDFDNTGRSTSIWRIGSREPSNYDCIYWSLLGQGDDRPTVDSKLRSETDERREVLPGPEHDRLRRTLAQQSKVLSDQLHRPVSLPKEGEFFLFEANGGRTYWAWDFGNSPGKAPTGEPPYGKEIHIVYTKGKKSDYIGAIHIMRGSAFAPCVSECVTSLNDNG